MTDIVIDAKDIVVEVVQPTTPSGAVPPPKVGLVEINQIVQRGSIWFTGSGAPVNPGGQFGDLYLDVDTGDIYRWDGDSWEYQGTFAPSTLTGPEILALLLPVDGAGSLLDADFLDGHDSLYFATKTALDANTSHDAVQDGLIAQNASDILQNASDISANEGQVADLQADKVEKAGDTMTGPLNVVTPPTAPANAASKAYVDSLTSAIIAAPPATVPPLMDGTAAVGVATKYAREDHRHPSDTSKIGDAPNDGVQYVRQSLNWAPVVVPPGTVVSDTPPASPLQGQMWFKSSTGVLYTWYTDPNSSAWIQVSASPQMVDNGYRRKTANRYNMVVNGALNVSQENGNTEGTTPGYYAADQMTMEPGGSGLSVGFSRVAVANLSGSQYRLQLRVITPKASLGTGDISGMLTKIEGLNALDLGWINAASQKDAVLTFGFKGPAGTYCASVNNQAGTHAFLAPFTITAGQANTDTVQTIKVPAPAGMTTWNTDNSASIYLHIVLAAGTAMQAAAGWNSSTAVGVTGMSNGVGVVQTFQVWDIYFGADPDKTGLAPPFEIEDYATTLAKCMRYYERTYRYDEQSYMLASGNINTARSWQVQKRTNPTVAYIYNNSVNAASFVIRGSDLNGVTNQLTKDATSGIAAYQFQFVANARM